jgi:hypothetical protein
MPLNDFWVLSRVASRSQSLLVIPAKSFTTAELVKPESSDFAFPLFALARHSRAGGNPAPLSFLVIPAKSFTTAELVKPESSAFAFRSGSSFPRKRESSAFSLVLEKELPRMSAGNFFAGAKKSPRNTLKI